MRRYRAAQLIAPVLYYILELSEYGLDVIPLESQIEQKLGSEHHDGLSFRYVVGGIV
jgi:hypothetical protein